MVYLPRILFNSVGFFNNVDTQNDVVAGRSDLPLSELAGVSDYVAVPLLQAFLKAFVTPNFAPPDWWPVLPFPIENPGDPTSWVGDENTAPTDPRDDDFYHPDPSTYANLKNGDIIAIREVGISAIWVNVAKAYQISFRSENTAGSPTADLTTVMIPNNPNGKVVSYQMWEDATSLQCSPSYSIITGISDPTLDILLILGYVVNWPDHEGVNSAFAAGIKEGKATLDSIRAYLSARSQIGLDTNSYDKIVMWGYSGGSVPTGHAAEMHPTYAPDLTPNLVGAIAGGFVVNVTQVINSINGGIFSGFGFAGIWGLSTEYPSIKEVLDEAIRPGIRWRYNQVGQTCIFENLFNNILQNVWSYTDDDTGATYLNDPRVTVPLQQETLGVRAAPQIPMIVYQGVQDEIIDVYEVDRVVTSWCQAGTKVDYYRLAEQEHISTEVLSIIDALKWIAKFHSGYIPASCSGIEDATRGTTVSTGDDQISNLCLGNWADTGILSMDGVRPS